jgi:hypothetical protein
MKVRKLLFLFIPLLIVCMMFFGYTKKDLTSINEMRTYSMTAPPPLAIDSVLVIMNDSVTAATVQRKADRDTLRKYLPMLVSKVRYMTKDTNTIFPPLGNYSLIIIQETSFDAGTMRGLSFTQRAIIKTWLATGTPGAKKNLMLIGGDLGYNYDRAASSYLDTTFSRNFGGFQFVVDLAGSPATFASVAQTPPGSIYDAMTIAPPGGSYWPDGCRPINGGAVFHRYLNRGIVDTVAGITKANLNWNVISTFQDPRYFTGVGDGSGDMGFKRVLKNMIAWIVGNGGMLTTVEPIGSQIVNDYKLSQNYPNPFNPTTKINFSIPKSGLTTLKVYDILGKEVATLINGFQNAGNYVVDFNASNLASGAYFYRLEVNGFVNTKKMLLIK